MKPDEPVSRIMTEAVVVIEADRPVSEALDCFRHYPIHHLPVVREGRLAGMLSSGDVMKLEFFVPGEATGRNACLDARLSIGQLMRSPVTSLHPSASVRDAAERMIDTGVHSVPIVDDADHVLGIVTTTDLIRSLLHGPPRRGTLPPPRTAMAAHAGEPGEDRHYYRRPAEDEYRTALQTAELLRAEARDPRHLGKAMLYLDQRVGYLEKVLELADRYLLTGQDEAVHTLLLKAILAAKRAEEHATGQARMSLRRA